MVLFYREDTEVKDAGTLAPSDLAKLENKEPELSQSERIARAVGALNVPINFFGRVVDQDGNSIEGALITFNARKGLVAGIEAVDELTTYSDSLGNFSARDLRGFRLSLENIEKEGFRLASRQIRNFNYDGGNPVETGLSNPQIYVMISIAEEMPVAFLKHRILSDWDGESIFFDLEDGIVEAENSDIVIISVREKRGENRYDWEFSVRSEEGGVALAPLNGSPTVAPLNGYGSEWSIGHRSDDEDYKGGFTRDSFVKLDDGRYARINFNVYVDERRTSSNIILRVFINESGGRVFEDGSTNSKH